MSEMHSDAKPRGRRSKTRQLVINGAPQDCPCDVRRSIRNGHNEVIAIQCSKCLREIESVCPVCQGLFPNVKSHMSRMNFGVCKYFFDRGQLNVTGQALTAWVAAEKTRRGK